MKESNSCTREISIDYIRVGDYYVPDLSLPKSEAYSLGKYGRMRERYLKEKHPVGLDIGEKTRELFAEAAKSAKTVVWNGPMGVFENPTLAKGTIAVAEALAEADAITIVGGGDSAAACEQLGFADKITHISTGGGASLEFLEGLELPGIACLEDK